VAVLREIDPALVRDYMASFYGYGHLGAEYWFIGLEEGGVGRIEEFEARLAAWSELGKPPLADIRAFHHKLGGVSWFAGNAPLQRTWRALIRTRYAAKMLPLDATEARRYQAHDLAGSTGDIALLELLPLPARGRKSDEPWFYGSIALPELLSRKSYVTAIREQRRKKLVELIDAYAPAAVVTYGEREEWRRHLNADTPLNSKAWKGRRGATVIVCTTHPEGARSNAHWDEIGHALQTCS
jgi:hypothetical protein